MTFEVWLRLSAFLLVLLLCALFEWRLPRRSWRFPKRSRWLTNLTLTLLNTVLARLTLGAFAITAAIWAGDQDIGLFQSGCRPPVADSADRGCCAGCSSLAAAPVTHRVPLLWRTAQGAPYRPGAGCDHGAAFSSGGDRFVIAVEGVGGDSAGADTGRSDFV